MDALVSAIGELVQRRDLSADQMDQAVSVIVDGLAMPSQIGAFLAALKTKGETPCEIAAAARALRRRAITIRADRPVLDTCGTGGDGSGTFNISTIVAFVLAGAGVAVAKHGNRGVSSQCGSADVLERLGVRLDLSPDQVLRCIHEVGIGFLYAPRFHQAMRHAAAVRREIGFRSLFNLVGPLTNPAGAEYQVVGVFDPALTDAIARVLAQLGSREAMVVASLDGLDELSVSDTTLVSHLASGNVRTFEVVPEDAGIRRADRGALRGGDVTVNARIALEILNRNDRGPRRSAVVLNAAAGLIVAGRAATWVEAAGLAAEVIDSGSALTKLEALIALSRALAPGATS